MTAKTETIAAIITPPGRGGVGIVRVSGPKAQTICKKIAGEVPTARYAELADFKDENDQIVDTGLVLYFKAPHSFTGEDVVEFQGHGGAIVQDMLLKTTLVQGARMARPGEFSERAFLNDKLDLAQAEAIADLIDSSTEQAARGAMRSLQGEFSARINSLLAELIHLRMYVEAAIDFPEEEIDFLADEKVANAIKELQTKVQNTLEQAGQGAILRNGFRIALAGKPNAGKSSLLNALSGYDAAIVTDIPGTTRDIVSEALNIDGMPLHIIDTAGLRDSEDKVEKIGIQRAQKEIEQADHVLFLLDASDTQPKDIKQLLNQHQLQNVAEEKITLVYNKIDLTKLKPGKNENGINISATEKTGIEELKEHIKQLAGFQADTETLFTARRRHLKALQTAQQAIANGKQQLEEHKAGELLAEELLHAQNALNEITGEFTPDDLLGEIFSRFCIGK